MQKDIVDYCYEGVSINDTNIVDSNNILVVCESFIHLLYAHYTLLLVGDICALISHYGKEAIADNTTEVILHRMCRTMIWSISFCMLPEIYLSSFFSSQVSTVGKSRACKRSNCIKLLSASVPCQWQGLTSKEGNILQDSPENCPVFSVPFLMFKAESFSNIISFLRKLGC